MNIEILFFLETPSSFLNCIKKFGNPFFITREIVSEFENNIGSLEILNYIFSLSLECKMTKNYVVWMSNRIGIDPKKDPDLVFISYLYCFEILGKKMG